MKVYSHTPILLLSILFCFAATNPGNCFASDIQQPVTDEAITENEIHGQVILFTTTSSRMKQTAFDQYSQLIHTKGGSVIDTFFLKTFWKESEEIEKEAQEMVSAKKELWLTKAQMDEPR